ncbi:MAG: hypothetical protein ACREHD_07400, partial [Pirellulales bacterium]
ISFQFSTTSGELPERLTWVAATPLTAWESSVSGAETARDGVTLPLAVSYVAGYSAAAGFRSLVRNDGVSIFQPASTFFQVSSMTGKSWTNLLYGIGLTEFGQNPLINPNGLPVLTSTFAPTLTQDIVTRMAFGLPIMGVVYEASPQAPPGPLTPSPVSTGENAPVPDDEADQDYANDGLGMGFNDTPLAQESEQSQRAPDTTPTASEQKQQTEQTVKEQTPDPLAAAKAEVQTQLLGVNYQDVPVERIDDMVTARMAFRSSQSDKYVYFVGVAGDQVVSYIVKRSYVKNADRVSYSEALGTYVNYDRPGPVSHWAYQVVWRQAITLGSGARPIGEILAAWDTQAEADRQFGAYFSRGSSQNAEKLLGTINFVVHAFPVSGTADYYLNGKYLEGTISLAGDAAFFLSMGSSR